MKKAFTMIELIFVIIMLGILTSIAIPKLNATRDDAENVKIEAALRNGTNEIITYALTQGKVESNLSTMSNSFEDLESSGIAVMSPYKMVLESGNLSDCVTLEINSPTLNDFEISYTDAAGNSACLSLQEVLKKINYNIKIRGVNVSF
jgi:prepilin-type N-terminal cleavage/methylation domain-containing protein